MPIVNLTVLQIIEKKSVFLQAVTDYKSTPEHLSSLLRPNAHDTYSAENLLQILVGNKENLVDENDCFFALIAKNYPSVMKDALKLIGGWGSLFEYTSKKYLTQIRAQTRFKEGFIDLSDSIPGRMLITDLEAVKRSTSLGSLPGSLPPLTELSSQSTTTSASPTQLSDYYTSPSLRPQKHDYLLGRGVRTNSLVDMVDDFISPLPSPANRTDRGDSEDFAGFTFTHPASTSNSDTTSPSKPTTAAPRGNSTDLKRPVPTSCRSIYAEDGELDESRLNKRECIKEVTVETTKMFMPSPSRVMDLVASKIALERTEDFKSAPPASASPANAAKDFDAAPPANVTKDPNLAPSQEIFMPLEETKVFDAAPSANATKDPKPAPLLNDYLKRAASATQMPKRSQSVQSGAGNDSDEEVSEYRPLSAHTAADKDDAISEVSSRLYALAFSPGAKSVAIGSPGGSIQSGCDHMYGDKFSDGTGSPFTSYVTQTNHLPYPGPFNLKG